ncbi:hypothetical protein [Streptomyces cavernae]|uniref:hypothetical protein n=1 Tax=Streptomyces cavernae TaxID=2259034 RepID=UPI000FEBBFE7|nr:hypothetical protein [Streptomyces cavernae]
MRPVSVGRTARLGACVTAAAGLLALTPAVPAFADETDQLWVDAPSELSLPLGVDGGPPQTRSLDLGLYHDNDNFTVTDGRLTVDISGLTGVAEVTWPDNCAPSGTTAVCSVPEVPTIGADYDEQIHLAVRAADGVAAGAQGRITYEATAVGGPDGTLTAPRESFDTTVTIAAGPDLALADVAPVKGAKPGTTETVPLALTNKGNGAANGFTLKMFASYGLEFPTKYDECSYTGIGGTDEAPMTQVTCAFDEVLEPGDSFALPAPLRVVLAGHAMGERLDLSVEPGGGATDISDDDNYVVAGFAVDNTADFAVTGAAVSGAAGTTVTAPLTFKNNGPGWLGNLGSGEAVAVVRLIVPQGTTVTGVPSGCEPRTLGGGYYPRRTGAPRYDCDLPYWVLENTQRPYAFTLRIDTVLPGTTGAVSIHPGWGNSGFPFDPDITNNTSVLAVN